MFPQTQKAVNNYPATGTAATIASETPASNWPIIVTGIVVSAAGAAVSSGPIQWVLRDGATGVGTIKMTGVVSGAIGDCGTVFIEGLELPMTPGNVATLETVTAPAATTQVAVTLLYKSQSSLNG